MKLLLIVVSLLFATVGEFAIANAADPSRPPNVIYILADDLGYGDLSCYGQTKFETPHVDALARRGMRFTQHYSGSTVCAPSRCALMTGLHTGHTPVRGNAEYKPEGQVPMPGDTYTVAKHLQDAGYRTGIFGKWGLGYPGSVSDPLRMGFERFYGYNCQRMAHCYYPAFVWNDDQRQLLWGNVGSHYRDYAPDLIHAEALKFIRENQEHPFFCYYAAIQPHADMVAPEKYMEKYRGKYLPEVSNSGNHYAAQPDGHAAFAAMVNVLDDYVGDVVEELENLGIAENTLVIFTSDNGPHLEGGHDPEYFDSNGPLRGAKRDLYEGGMRVPMIASWPGKIQAGSQSDHISAFWDFLPTLAEIIERPLPTPVDGISMLPALLGRAGQRQHDYLYWEFPAKGGRVAIRKGNWKGVRYNASKDPNSPLELYDLSVDRGETNNIADKYPEVAAELNDLLIQARTEAANPSCNF
jgi:arylsulfatase A-like enzyme